MAELADAHGSGPCEGDFMQVQLLLSAPYSTDKIDDSAVKPVGTGFFRVLRAKKRVKKP